MTENSNLEADTLPGPQPELSQERPHTPGRINYTVQFIP